MSIFIYTLTGHRQGAQLRPHLIGLNLCFVGAAEARDAAKQVRV